MSSISTAIRFSPDEKQLIQKYAEIHKQNFSDVVRRAILDKIEDEYDLALLKRAIETDEGNHASHKEIMREFGLA